MRYIKSIFTFLALPKTLLALAIVTGVLGMLVFRVFATQAPQVVNPVTQPPSGYEGAKVTFSFDDGYKSFLTEAAPVLNTYGFAGTAYLTSDYLESRHADFLSWDEARRLQDTYQWEIGGHSLTHPKMPELNSDNLFTEVQANYNSLKEHGLNPQTFATPFGAYDGEVIAEVATKFTGHRTFHDDGYNKWPYNDYLLKVQQVQVGVSVDKVKEYIDHAIETDTWLILVFHDIADRPKQNPDSYQYATTNLDAIAKYLYDKNVPVTTVANGLVADADNLLKGGSFTGGLSEGWIMDAPYVRLDNNRHGVVPEPQYSVEMRALSTRDIQLYSPKVSVKPGNQYAINAYVNIMNRNGEVGLYIDEYDATGEWIRGKYHEGTLFGDEKSTNIAYTPSGGEIAFARIQFIAAKGSNTHAYIDEVSWTDIGQLEKSISPASNKP